MARSAGTIEVRTGDRPMIIETTGDGTVHVRLGTTEHPDAVLTGHPRPLLGLLAGRLDLQQAAAQGVHYEGDPGTLTRVLPPQPSPPNPAGPAPATR